MLKQKQQLELNKDEAKIKDDTHIVQIDYMKTEEFKTLYKECHKLETKKCRIKKNNYNYGKANSCVKLGITIQEATTLSLVNMRRIIKLNQEKYMMIIAYIYIILIKLTKKLIVRKYF